MWKFHPGKNQQVNIELTPASFEFVDWNQRKMMVTTGEYEVYYGNSLDSKNLRNTKITIR